MYRSNQRGSALIIAMTVTVVAVTIAYSALSISTRQQQDAKLASRDLQTRYAAEAGIHRGLRTVQAALDRSSGSQPLQGLDNLLLPGGVPQKFAAAVDEPLIRNGRSFGSFSVSLDSEVRGNGRDVTIRATGYFPDAQSPLVRRSIEIVVHVEVGASDVFDYAYFINNWSWYYGDAMVANGNVRSNGQFDFAGHNPTVNGAPTYDSVNGGVLGNLTSTGGVFSGWDIANSSNVQGMGGVAANQYDFEEQIPMPDLNDLSLYEARALSQGSTIEVGGQLDGAGNPIPNAVVCDAVLGDAAGELPNLVLIGTPSEPIVLNGTVVVRGDVIIKGTVTGQGSIYAEGNVYIADDLTYLNPPSTVLPASDSRADTEAWLLANQGADFLALHAKENIVMGDYLDSTWRTYVDAWLGDPMNPSTEDAGTDHMPGTAAGRDGKSGTEDDDVLEGDGQWTVEHYTQEDYDLGLVPPGFQIGDVVPGSGEDIDGDGVFDTATTYMDLLMDDPLDSAHWAGNLPTGISSYSDIASTLMTHVDGALFTNHAAAMVSLESARDFHFFGSFVSRNECVIYGNPTMNFNYDRRLLGGGENAIQNLMPRTVKPVQQIAWRVLDQYTDVGNELKSAAMP